jgi:hypothetical protein
MGEASVPQRVDALSVRMNRMTKGRREGPGRSTREVGWMKVE